MVFRTSTEIAAVAPTAPRMVSGRIAAGLGHAWRCAWWLVRAHVADVHLLPREEALEPPPAEWLEGLVRPPKREARR
jgi:hypothetical protein